MPLDAKHVVQIATPMFEILTQDFVTLAAVTEPVAFWTTVNSAFKVTYTHFTMKPAHIAIDT